MNLNFLFAPGDEVVCTDDKGQSYLSKGKTYVVEKVEGHRMFIKGYRRYSFLVRRFEHVRG